MIILIDGPLCVGKTTVADILKENMQSRDVVIMDADDSKYSDFTRIDPQPGDVKGTALRYHTTFCRNFGKEITKEAEEHEIIIVPMCLEWKPAKEYIADRLKTERDDVYHIILLISKDRLMDRVNTDENESRQKDVTISEYDICAEYIDVYYDDAIKIDTDYIDASNVASEIQKIIGVLN